MRVVFQLRGLVIPGGGDIVVGQEYTDFDKGNWFKIYNLYENYIENLSFLGLEDGIEGEIYGFNMILSSTTEEPNHKYYHSHSKDSLEIQSADNLRTDSKSDYVRIIDLNKPKVATTTRRPFLKIEEDSSALEDQEELVFRNQGKPKLQRAPIPSTSSSNIPFWNMVNQAGREGKFKASKEEFQSLAALTNLPIYETPPSPPIYDDSQKTTPSFEVLYSQQNFKGNQWYDQNDYFPRELFKTWRFKQTKKQQHGGRSQHRQRPNKSKNYNKDLFPYPSENFNVYVTDGDHSIFKRETKEKNVEILNPNTVLLYPVSVEVYPRAESTDYVTEEENEDRLKNHNKIDKENGEESYEVLYSKLHYTGGVQQKKRLEKEQDSETFPSRYTVRRYPESITDKINDATDYRKNERDDQFEKKVKLGNALGELRVFKKHGDDRRSSFVGETSQVPDIYKYRSDIDKDLSSIYVFDDVNVNNHRVSDNWKRRHPEDLQRSKSPKSAGRKLVELSYKKCLLDRGSPLARDAASIISWTLTPVRVFGGAVIKNAAPRCGHF